MFIRQSLLPLGSARNKTLSRLFKALAGGGGVWGGGSAWSRNVCLCPLCCPLGSSVLKADVESDDVT